MTRVLLTGGSGFIAAHVLETLLARGHSVVTTVRSQTKADAIQQNHPEANNDRLSFAIVEDMAQPNGISVTTLIRWTNCSLKDSF
jgi:Nucleoside-diphosphate-sugar epimerases